MLDKSLSEKDFKLFKEDITEKLNKLQNEIRYKVTESEQNIKNIEDEANKSIKNIENQKITIESYIEKIESSQNEVIDIVQKVSKEYDEIENIIQEVNRKQEETESLKNDFLSSKETFSNILNEINDKKNFIDEMFSTAEKLPQNIENINSILDTSEELYNEIESLKSHSIDKKSKIDKLYDEIYGKNIESTDGNIEHTDGLIDKLKVSYKNIEDKLNGFDELVNKNMEDKKLEFENLLKKSTEEFNEVKDKLTSLLPGAMASGLSSAYIKKTKEETKLKEKLEKNFVWSIVGLLVISLIPVGVDIHRLSYADSNLVQVIKDTPNLIIAILPIYFPILWFAYSSNKKLNLSKRLIEEYTHKAVLGNTFEGLSTQIETLTTNDEIRNELRTKLLFNLLEVSSENPGKLITDYQTSDHPFMEALENSTKLSKSIDKLDKIPGLQSIVKKLSLKNKKNMKEIEDNIKVGLEANENLEKN